MPITTIANMQIVPEKFSQYVIDRTTELNTFVNSGIAAPDATVAALINGTPQGGRFIQIPMYNPLEGEEDVFGEDDVSIGGVTTKDFRATLLIRQKAWGDTDLSRVLGGSDPMGAIAQLMADWRNTREQKIYLAILKGILDPTDGALKCHVNDVSSRTGTAANISQTATLDTKQLLGDHYGALGMVFMHSATYTYLQKNDMIARTPVFNPAGDTVEIQTYLGYRITIDDSMPVKIDGTYAKTTDTTVTEGKTYYVLESDGTYTAVQTPVDENIGNYYEMTKAGTAVYDTYFLGSGAFIRQDGSPQGFIGTETDRDKLGAKNYLINRWCQIIHPRGMSWVSDGTYTKATNMYPANVDLAVCANWKLITDHKKVPIACLRHKLG